MTAPLSSHPLMGAVQLEDGRTVESMASDGYEGHVHYRDGSAVSLQCYDEECGRCPDDGRDDDDAYRPLHEAGRCECPCHGETAAEGTTEDDGETAPALRYRPLCRLGKGWTVEDTTDATARATNGRWSLDMALAQAAALNADGPDASAGPGTWELL